MAFRAAARPVEELLPRLRVAGLEVFDVDRAPAPDERFRLQLRIVDEGHHRRNVCLGKSERRHAFFGTAVTDNGADLVPAHVLRDERGAREVWPRFSTHRIAPVTEPAL